MEVSSWQFDEFYEIFTNVNVIDYEPRRELKLHGYRIGLFAAYACLVVVGGAGNGWVITVISRLLRQPRTEAPRSVQIYILSLCCFDLLSLLFLPLLLLDFAYGQWIIPVPWLCKLYFTSESVSKFGAPFLLTSLAGFCYVTICRQGGKMTSSASTPSLFRSLQRQASSRLFYKPSSSKFACVMVCACTGIVLALLTPVYIFSDLYYVMVRNGSEIRLLLPKCVLQPPERLLTIFTVYSFTLGFVVPLVLITFFYASVLGYVHRNDKWMRAERSQRFWRVAKTSMCLVGFYVSCWAPYWSMSLYYYFTPHTNSEGRTRFGLVFSYVIHMLPYINCSGYPILYTLSNRRIREDYSKAKAVMRDRKRRRQLAQETRDSLHSDGSFSANTPPAGGSAFAFLWTLSKRQRYSAHALRRAQFGTGGAGHQQEHKQLQSPTTSNTPDSLVPLQSAT